LKLKKRCGSLDGYVGVETGESDNETDIGSNSVGEKVLKPDSPLMMYDPVFSDVVHQNNHENNHLFRKKILMFVSFVLHATALVALVLNPGNLCSDFFTRASLYVCLANSSVFSLIASGCAPQFVHMYSQHLFIVPVLAWAYSSAQILQCALDAG
jgi:hypothetical protein